MSGGAGPAGRTASICVLFCDLVGSTARQSRLGDDAADEFRHRYYAALRTAVAETGGEEVKNTGDGLMVLFRHSSVDALGCAAAMHRGVEALDADEPARIYVGISAGEAIADDNDWFGAPVNEAARLCAAAKPGQTLTTEVVRALVGSRGGFEFRSAGRLTLKGLPQPVAAIEVVRPANRTDETSDPEARQPESHKRLLMAALAALVAVATIGAIVGFSRATSKSGSSVAGAAGAPTAYPTSYTGNQKCPRELAARISGLTCGVLTVPEDRSKRHSPVVELDVYRAPAREEVEGDPVLDFGADDLVNSPARDHHEEIQLAQRGWGGTPRSDPALDCPEYTRIAPDALAKPSSDPAERERDAQALRHCHDRWTDSGVDLSQYNYVAMGDDMVDLIRALHLPRVHLVSGYVATISATQTIRRLPGVVESLTLQEPVEPGESAYTDPTRYLSVALNNYVALCHADRGCRQSFPDLPGDFRRAYETYRAQPRMVMGDDGDGHRHAVWLDAGRTTRALQDALSNRDTYPFLAAVIAAKERTGAIDTAAADRVVHAAANLFDQKYAWGAVLSNLCSYDVHTVDRVGSAVSRRTIPELSGIDDGWIQWVCETWPVREIDDVAYDDVATSVPTLIVVPSLQPGTDPRWADTLRRGLPHATIATFPTLDGNVLASNEPACLADLRRAFIAEPNRSLAAETASCERKSPRIDFVASLGG
jgi:class 3 adenylate cyclase